MMGNATPHDSNDRDMSGPFQWTSLLKWGPMGADDVTVRSALARRWARTNLEPMD